MTLLAELPELDALDPTDLDAISSALDGIEGSDTRLAVLRTVLGQLLVDSGQTPYVEAGLVALRGAADAGISAAAFSAATTLLGHGPEGIDEAIELLEAAADAGLAPAQLALGQLLLEADNPEQGLAFVAAAAGQGYAPAACDLSRRLLDGEIIGDLQAEDIPELLRGAITEGSAEAHEILLQYLATAAEYESLVSELGASAGRRRLPTSLLRDVGAALAEADPHFWFQAAIALAPLADDSRVAFLDGILLSISTDQAGDAAALQLALGLNEEDP